MDMGVGTQNAVDECDHLLVNYQSTSDYHIRWKIFHCWPRIKLFHLVSLASFVSARR
jgi:hypothetical protein